MMPIHHTFGPHATWKTCLQAKFLWLQPWRWQKGRHVEQLRQGLMQQWNMSVSLFATGRECLLALLQASNIQPGDEVIVQGYTCAVVINAIRAAGATPVYADIEESSLTVNIQSVRNACTDRTKIIVCQHTFGIPANTAALRALCDEKQLLLIEDCAHVLPDTNSTIGTHGDALFFSFGRDKAISGITGGAIATNNTPLATALQSLEKRARHLPRHIIGRLLLYPCWYVLCRPLYSSGLGKGILRIARMLGLLIPYVSTTEKSGNMPRTLQKIPNACAALAYTQWRALTRINTHRRFLTTLYLQAAEQNNWSYPAHIHADMPLQKFPIFVPHADEVRTALRAQHIYLEDGWCGAVVCPRTTDAAQMFYTPGSCPVAEQKSTTILTLPTHPNTTEQQARTLVQNLQVLCT